MYIYVKNGIAYELIPDINPSFPNIPIEERYTAEFLAACVVVADDTEVMQNWLYDAETGTFAEPGPLEPVVDDSITTTPDELDTAYRSGVNSYE